MGAVYGAAFAAALLGALVATPVARRLALHLGIVDMPAARKVHTDPVPYLGGLAIILAFVGSMVLGVVVHPLTGSYEQVAAILGGGLVLAGMGLIDDLKVIPGWIKVPTEVAMGVLLYVVGVAAHPFRNALLDVPLNVGWVVGITNAVNYMDNMDGLSAGVVVIAAGYFFALAALSGQILVASLAAALTGCALGFLWWNRPPARIFMGDTGSLFLGFTLAAIGMKLRFHALPDRVGFFVPIAVMAIPILDALMVSVSRVQRGLSPIHPGKDHMSHRLVRVGIPSRAAVGLIYFASASCGWLGVIVVHAHPLTAYLLMGWLVVVALFLGWLLLRVTLLIGLFLSPLIFLRTTIDVFNLVKISTLWIFGVFAVAIWAIWAAERGAWLPKLHLFWAAGAFLVAILLATVFSQDPGLSFLGLYHRYGGLLPFLLYAVIGLVIVGLYWERPDDLKEIHIAITGACLVMIPLVLWQATKIQCTAQGPFCIPWRASNGQPPSFPVGTMGNSNFAGGFFALAAPLFLYVVLTAKHLAVKLLLAAGFILELLALWFTQ